jgi:uncharacterized protein (TIGR00251 family)
VEGPKGGDFRTAHQPPWLDARKDRLIVSLHVQPGARRTAIVGTHGERLKIAVGSPPTDGRANTALIEFLAQRLDLPKSALQLVAGAGSREKRVAIDADVPAERVVAALSPGDRQ